MTGTADQDNLACIVCGNTHPRHLSVLSKPSGLACGLTCMSTEIRTLLGLPDPEDAAIGGTPAPPTLQAWARKPSKYFTITMTEQITPDPRLDQNHFRYALNQYGLPMALRAGYGNPEAQAKMSILGKDVTFMFSVYTAAQRLHIWVDALTTQDTPQLIRGARLSWSDLQSDADSDRAHAAAVEFVSNQSGTEHQGNKEHTTAKSTL